MIFCGQCGLQLAPGNSVCPRCGTPTETDLVMENRQSNNNAVPYATNVAPPNYPYPDTPFSQPQQQTLILRAPDSGYTTGGQPTSDATSMMNAPAAPWTPPSAIINAPTAYPYYTPSNSYPQQGIPSIYPGYPPQIGASYPPMPGQVAEPQSEWGRIIFLFLLLFFLLALFGGMIYFFLTYIMVRG